MGWSRFVGSFHIHGRVFMGTKAILDIVELACQQGPGKREDFLIQALDFHPAVQEQARRSGWMIAQEGLQTSGAR